MKTPPKITQIKTHMDNRGFFKTIFHDDELIDVCISYNRKGTFRGLHAQAAPFEQSKYIHVLKGEIIDLVYDPESKTMQEFSLSENDNQVLYVPKGYAHGFFAKADTMLLYGIVGEYSPENAITYSIYNLPEAEYRSKQYILDNIKHISLKDAIWIQFSFDNNNII
jgi:dTDP-4-dehydrorhamnose 3,5-epimerase